MSSLKSNKQYNCWFLSPSSEALPKSWMSGTEMRYGKCLWREVLLLSPSNFKCWKRLFIKRSLKRIGERPLMSTSLIIHVKPKPRGGGDSSQFQVSMIIADTLAWSPWGPRKKIQPVKRSSLFLPINLLVDGFHPRSHFHFNSASINYSNVVPLGQGFPQTNCLEIRWMSHSSLLYEISTPPNGALHPSLPNVLLFNKQPYTPCSQVHVILLLAARPPQTSDPQWPHLMTWPNHRPRCSLSLPLISATLHCLRSDRTFCYPHLKFLTSWLIHTPTHR